MLTSVALLSKILFLDSEFMKVYLMSVIRYIDLIHWGAREVLMRYCMIYIIFVFKLMLEILKLPF